MGFSLYFGLRKPSFSSRNQCKNPKIFGACGGLIAKMLYRWQRIKRYIERFLDQPAAGADFLGRFCTDFYPQITILLSEMTREILFFRLPAEKNHSILPMFSDIPNFSAYVFRFGRHPPTPPIILGAGKYLFFRRLRRAAILQYI